MNFLKICEKHFAFVGLKPPQSIPSHAFNANNLIALCVLSAASVSSIVFFFSESYSFNVYTDSIYLMCTLVVSSINLAMLILKMKNCFIFIEHFMCTIQKRKLKIQSKCCKSSANCVVMSKHKMATCVIDFTKNQKIC